MASDEPSAVGHCLCGGVRFALHGPLRDVIVCHCSRCRRTHGHVGAYTSVPAPALTLLAEDTLRWYIADGRERGFCAGCGASLFWRITGSDHVSVSAGALDLPTGLRISHHIHTVDASDYYRVPGH